MSRAGAGLIVTALLALAGCRSTDPKAKDKTPIGLGASRAKADANNGKDPKGALAKGPTWLDDLDKYPGAGTAIPKSTGPTDPKDRNFDSKTAAQDAIGGRVFDPYGRPARNVFVRIEQVGASDGPGELGIDTNNEGHFFSTGFKAGQSYELSVSVTTEDGKLLAGSVQTKVPNVTLSIQLRDDLPPRAGSPRPKTSDTSAPFGQPNGPAPAAQPKPLGDAWSPSIPSTSVPPATIGSAATPPAVGNNGNNVPAPGSFPQPDDLAPSPSPRPVKPENVADGPKAPFKSPPASIPNPAGGPSIPPATGSPNPAGGPPVQPLPKLPPTFSQPGSNGKSSMGTTTGRATASKFTLLDTLGRPWDSSTIQPDSLVLVEFMTSSCVPCKKAVPALKELQSRYGASGLQVMGVLCDELAQKERIAAAAQYGFEQNLNYALYVEPVRAGSVRDRFNVEEYPHAILFDATGRTLWRGHPGTDRGNLEAAVKANLAK